MADDHQAVIAEALRDECDALQHMSYHGGLKGGTWYADIDPEGIGRIRALLFTSSETLASLTQQLQDAETALAWFADESNYDFDGPDHDSAAQAYGLDRARAALAAAGAGEA